jgi:hypothetical protein
MPNLQFEICTGPVDVGWCDFTVRLGDGSWSCAASYVDLLPISQLVYAAVDLYDHYFEYGDPIDDAIRDVLAADEPGGIVVRLVPEADKLRVTVFHYPMNHWMPKPDELPEIPPVASGLIDFWTFANAVYEDAARTLSRHGVIGLRMAWNGKWHVDDHHPVFPFEHFLYLTALLKSKSRTSPLTFREELALLDKLEEASD